MRFGEKAPYWIAITVRARGGHGAYTHATASATKIATRIATVLCGGEIDRGSLVDEDWLLRLEREHFVALAQMPKTQERIAHMLKTGKPLRN